MQIDQKDVSEYLSFGDSLIADSRELVLGLWKDQAFTSELKEDQTPVSQVDLQCEEMLRDRIRERYPEHGIIGEEYGSERGDAEFVWTIDPIDGTQNLIHRIPTFGTIIGLLYRGRPVLGWIEHPVLGDSLRGGVGVGAFSNGRRVDVGDIAGNSLSANDVIATNCPATFGKHVDVLWKILKYHPHVRMYYDVYAHSLAVAGSLAAMIEYNLKIWDLAATQALIEGAGGEYRELGREEESGKPTKYHAVFGKRKAVDLIASELREVAG
jgi:inositol-phosphate phosphatase/L-galactose 1-phosphate phosphatase/histidinol-phosphatase